MAGIKSLSVFSGRIVSSVFHGVLLTGFGQKTNILHQRDSYIYGLVTILLTRKYEHLSGLADLYWQLRLRTEGGAGGRK